MKTICDIFKSGRKLKEGLGEFGIEIETETKSGSCYPKDFFGEAFLKETRHGQKAYWQPKSIPEWYATEDGSLRDFGREFIFKNPLDYSLAMAALESWGTALREVNFTRDAPATSVHVHMNINNFTPVQLANLLCLLIFFENLLTEFSGPMRRSNTFARPIRCAEQSIDNFHDLINGLDKGKKNAIVFSESHTKYGTINLATISEYGSVEIRCFRGTTDYAQIQDWLTILNRIYKFSKVPGLTPLAFYETYQEITTEIVDRVFGSDAGKLKCKDWKKWLERNEFYLADFATLLTDWNNLGSKYDNKKEEPGLKINKGPSLHDLVYGGDISPTNDTTTVVVDGYLPEPWEPDHEDDDDGQF